MIAIHKQDSVVTLTSWTKLFNVVTPTVTLNPTLGPATGRRISMAR